MASNIFTLQGLVSTNKRRYQHDGYDLDLSYITPRIIAMGFPCDGTSGLYRNPVGQVQQFLETRHAGNYKVYNLCVERGYNNELFHGRVLRLPMYDGQAPPLHLLLAFCLDAAAWLAADPAHVIAVHCKAGKGRTGAAVCAMLLALEPQLDDTSLNVVLSHWATQRTKDGKGVTISSQLRFVSYFHKLLLAAATPGGPTTLINGVAAKAAKAAQNGTHDAIQPAVTSTPAMPATIQNGTLKMTTQDDPISETHQPTSLLKQVVLPHGAVRLCQLHVQGLPLSVLRNCTVCVWWRPVGHYEAHILYCVRTRLPRDELSFTGCTSPAADMPLASTSSGSCPAGVAWSIRQAEESSQEGRHAVGNLLLDLTTLRLQPQQPPSPRPLSYYTPLAEPPVSAPTTTTPVATFCNDRTGTPKPVQRGPDVMPSPASSQPLTATQPSTSPSVLPNAIQSAQPGPFSSIPNAFYESSNAIAADASDADTKATSAGGPVLTGDIKIQLFRGSVSRLRHDIFQGRASLFSAWLGSAFLDPRVGRVELAGTGDLDKVAKPLRRLGSRLALVLDYERVS